MLCQGSVSSGSWQTRKIAELDKEKTQAETHETDGAFIGRFDHALDPKKRLTVPSEWRGALGASGIVYVFPNSEGCLDLVPKADMDVRLAKLRAGKLFDKKVNALLQAIGANSEQVSLDSQGRIRICDRLLGFASLKGKVTMCGAVRMIKLWAPEKLVVTEAVDMEAFDAAIQELDF